MAEGLRLIPIPADDAAIDAEPPSPAHSDEGDLDQRSARAVAAVLGASYPVPIPAQALDTALEVVGAQMDEARVALDLVPATDEERMEARHQFYGRTMGTRLFLGIGVLLLAGSIEYPDLLPMGFTFIFCAAVVHCLC